MAGSSSTIFASAGGLVGKLEHELFDPNGKVHKTNRPPRYRFLKIMNKHETCRTSVYANARDQLTQ